MKTNEEIMLSWFPDELRGFADNMRQAGVRRLAFQEPMLFGGCVRVRSIELFDTIPAPSPADLWGPLPTEAPPEPENKGPGTCIALGCVENNGWSFDTRYCAAHGRFAAGVKP